VSFYCLLSTVYSLMADYFLLLDGKTFEGEVRPALAASWRQRSFEPCRALCAGLASAARSYAERYHVVGESLVVRAAAGLPFDRAIWRLLVGERQKNSLDVRSAEPYHHPQLVIEAGAAAVTV
jgi:hypothetical protein